MKRYLVCAAALLLAAGCNKEKPSDAPAASASVAAVAPSASVAPVASAEPAAPDTAVAAAPVAPAVVAKIPTEEDFETVAASQITAANAGQQLTAIEKEIAK